MYQHFQGRDRAEAGAREAVVFVFCFQQALGNGEFVTILEDWPPTENFELYLVLRPAKYLPQRVRALTGFLKNHLSHRLKVSGC